MLIKFKDNQSNFEFCDCRGLVNLILKEEFNIILPKSNVSCFDAVEIRNREIREKKKIGWKRTNERKAAVVILFCTEVPRVIDHMGIMINNYEFIHINSRLFYPTINSINHRLWSKLAEGFYVPA